MALSDDRRAHLAGVQLHRTVGGSYRLYLLAAAIAQAADLDPQSGITRRDRQRPIIVPDGGGKLAFLLLELPIWIAIGSMAGNRMASMRRFGSI